MPSVPPDGLVVNVSPRCEVSRLNKVSKRILYSALDN